MNGHVRTSAVGARALVTQDDTSLALSTPGQTNDPPGRASVDQRSIRVKEQVKMSLARKATKNSGVLGATNAYSSKLNGSSFHNNSAIGNLGRRPTKRLEVSPPPSPEISTPSRFNHNVYQSRLQTSRLGRSQVIGNAKSFHRSISEPYNNKTTAKLPSVPIGRSIRQTGGAQSMFSSRVSQQNVTTNSFRQMEPQKTEQNNDNWLNKPVKDPPRSTFLKSYPPSVASSEKLVESQVQLTRAPKSGFQKNQEMTLDQAFTYLIQNNEEKQVEAIRCVQREFLLGSHWKELVFNPKWIEQLLQLLSNDNEGVQLVAAGALRVVVYQNDEKKMKVKQKKGLPLIADALKCSKDKETRRQLTGILWSLSAHDEIKQVFSEKELQALTSVLVPSSGIGDNPKDVYVADYEAFYSATGCLRNLSSADANVRNAMRTCEKLIDSIVYYIRGTLPDCRGDDKSTENCICILQNLSYMVDLKPQLSSEPAPEISPELSLELSREAKGMAEEKSEKTSVGCFPSHSVKEKPLPRPPALIENANPVGMEWLSSPILIRTYLSLMTCSGRECICDGAVGALQNITAGNGQESESIAYFIALEKGVLRIKEIFGKSELLVNDKTIIQLIGNLSRYKSVQPEIVKHLLKRLVESLPNNDRGDREASQVAASICHILINLTTGDISHAKAIIKLKALTKINNISRIDNGDGPSPAGRAACVLLQLMWKHSELHSYIKKVSGLKKKHFINKRTKSVMASEEQKQKLSKQ